MFYTFKILQENLSKFLFQHEIREGCTIGKIKTYKPNETILGDGVGLLNFTYFILHGQCRLIHVLEVNHIILIN